MKARYGLRKEYAVNNAKKPACKIDYHRSKACPVDGCMAVTKVMSRHLRSVHKISPKEERYKVLLSRAVSIDRGKRQNVSCQPKAEKRETLVPLLLQDDDLESDSNDSSFKALSSHPTNSCQDPDEDASLSSDSANPESIEESDADYLSSLGSDNQSNEGVVKDMMKSFLLFLTSADSGNKDEKSARQCQVRVLKILQVIDQELNLESLVDRRLLRDVFLKRYCKDKQLEPKTIQTYLKSLEHFFDFVLSEGISAFDMTNVTSLKSRLKTWKSSYITQVKVASMAKMEKDRRSKVTPEHIVRFEQTFLVRETVKLFASLAEGKRAEITQSRFTNARDFLMTEILIDNGHRAGVLANMTMEEFRLVEKRQDQYVITVFKHKEARAGPVRVTMSPRLFEWLNMYVEHIRSSAVSNESGNFNVFVTWGGGRFANSGGVTNACSAFWKKAGMEGRVGANKFRKAAVSATRSARSGDDKIHNDLANLMGHKKSTADRYYYLEDKLESSDRAASALPKIMRGGLADEPHDDRSKQPAVVEVEEQQRKRVAFSVDEVRAISTSFAKEIDEGAPITMDIVHKKVAESPILNGKNERRIYDKVRKMASQVSKKSVLKLPAEKESLEDRIARFQASAASSQAESSQPDSDSEFTIAATSKVSKDLFTKHEVQLLQKGFANLIKKRSVTESAVQLAISTHSAAKIIGAKFKLSTIKNRLKYEIRKLRAEDKSTI